MKKITELFNLTGRKALVTGGAGHVGQIVCATLQELGARVASLDLKKTSGPAVSYLCDLREEKQTRQMVRQVLADWKGLDILIHAAAYVGTTSVAGWAAPFEDQTVSAWEEGFKVNLTAAFILAQETRKSLENSDHGSIIFFNSIYGSVGHDAKLYEGTDMRFPIGYAASKGGLLQLTRQLAVSFAPKIRVNAISPGGILRGQPEIFQKRYCERTPLRRMATEEDLRGAVAFLASDASAYVTGENLQIDGGFTIW